MLRQGLELSYPSPISRQMARDVGGYQAGLTLYRQDQIETWISWFANAVLLAATTSTHELERIAGVQQRWHAALSRVRRHAAARRLADQLPAHPAADIPSVSRPAAFNAIITLEEHGILTAFDTQAVGRNPRERWWVAADLLR